MQRSAFKALSAGTASAAFRSALGEGLFAAAFGLLISLFHMLWTWGYTRAAVRLRSVAAKVDTEGSAALFTKCKGVRQSLDVGSSIGIVGAIAAFIGAEQVIFRWKNTHQRHTHTHTPPK
jgi:hypothetical protein